MPRGVRIQAGEISLMMGMFHRLHTKEGMALTETYKVIGEAVGRDHKTVCDVIKRYLPTTDLATAILRAGAVDMAQKIIRKGTVSEMIDVLERPNIGVLDPVKKGGGESESGFMLTVSADTLGAVKVGVAVGGAAQKAAIDAPAPRPALPAGVVDAESVTVTP